MFVRLVRFKLSEASPSRSQAIADAMIAAIKGQPGLVSAIFFGGGDDGECGLAVVWDTQEHADKAAAIVRPKLEELLAGNLSAPPDAKLFPVLAS